MDELMQNEVKDVDAQPDLGVIHEQDQGGQQDIKQAADWYQKAAEQGNAEAQFALGQIYENGQGVLQDHQQAAIWYRKAAEQGHADAQFQLGRIYHKSQAVPGNQHVTPRYREGTNRVQAFLCKHRYALAVVVGLIVVSIFFPKDILKQSLRLESSIDAIGTAVNENNSNSNEIPTDATPQWQDYQVRNGENLTTIFNNLGLHTTTLYKVLDADTKNQLARLKPGQTIEVLIDDDHILEQLKIRLNIKQTLVFARTGDSYSTNMLNEKVEWQQKVYDGVINGSFYVSARNAGIPANHIQKAANLFQWRFNFAKDLEKGDKFRVLVRQETVEGQSTGNTQLLGVEMLSQGKGASAWLWEDSNYYDGEGNSLVQREPARDSVEFNRANLSMAEPLHGNEKRRFLALVKQYRQALSSNGDGELKQSLVNIPLPGLEPVDANRREVAKDDKQTITKYRKAAEQGDATAQYNLGVMYDNGRGVAQDYKQAITWYRKAAEQGDVGAQVNLGFMYAEGQGVTRNDKQAVTWYRKAAEQGDATAQNNLGVMYAIGRGVARDYKQAVTWYRKSAEQDYATAQNNLGVMYENGRGITKDNKQALTWFRKAAKQGDIRAQYNLRTALANGQEVVQDDKLALAWRRLAANSTDSEVMLCEGFNGAMRELENLQLMDDKYKEIKVKLDAIDERRAQAVIDGNSAENMDDNRDEKVLINEANILNRVAEKKTAVLEEWWDVCAAEIADRRAEVYQLKLKRTREEAARQAKLSAERKAAEQLRLQKEMEATAKANANAKKIAMDSAASRDQVAPLATESEVGKYADLIKTTIERYMILAPTMRGKTCVIGVKLASSGFVISVDNGRGDPAVCRSGKTAVLKAKQLPVPKDPAAFEMLKEFTLKLEPNI